ncbi:MAG: hypothetical protein JWN23_2838 [Rhodocyclales bacterium]|nr:hypothetical protein [Rhodocyclales bacterium]
MKLVRLIAALAIASCPFLAEATVFDFSYTFGSGAIASGQLTGTQNGIFVDNVSNVSVSLNGHALVGGDLYQPYAFIAGCCFVAMTPVISFDGNLNNFIFANGPPNDPSDTNFFTFDGVDGPWQHVALSLPPYPYETDVSLNGVGYTQPDGHVEDAFDASRWSLTVDNAVPEPATFALVGLGLLMCVRRRKLAGD